MSICTSTDDLIAKNVHACTNKNDLIVENYNNAYTNTDDLIVKNHADAFTSTDELAKNVNVCTSTNDLIVKKYIDVCTNTDDLVKNHIDVCTNIDDLVKNNVDVCTNTDDLVKNNVDVCTSKDDLVKNYVYVCTNDSDSDSDIDDDNDDKTGTSGNNKPNKNDNRDNKLSKSDNNKENKDNKDNNKSVNNEESYQVSPSKLFSNNIANITKLVDELENDDIYDADEWLVFMQLNKINLLVDELIDNVWLSIYNKNKEKNEIINIDIDKRKDIKGYIKIYKKTIDDKLEFVNKIVELYNNAIDKKESNNLKDNVLKLIDFSPICDVERKLNETDNNKKDSGAKRKTSKKEKDKDKDMDKNNFSDKVLNNLISIAKLKEKISINREKATELNLPIKDIKLKLDNYKKINI